MTDVIIEVYDAEPEIAALRGAIPEPFDAAAIVDGARSLITSARERVAEGLVAVDKIAVDAGWPAGQVARLRAEVVGAVDGVADAVVPDAVQFDVTLARP